MKLTRQAYADLYGPTLGDRVRLGDTNLVLESSAISRPTAKKSRSAAAR